MGGAGGGGSTFFGTTAGKFHGYDITLPTGGLFLVRHEKRPFLTLKSTIFMVRQGKNSKNFRLRRKCEENLENRVLGNTENGLKSTEKTYVSTRLFCAKNFLCFKPPKNAKNAIKTMFPILVP